MERKKRSRLSEHELRVMHLFWEGGEMRHERLEEVVESIGYGRDEAMEIVRKLVDRGTLDHREEESTYLYSPLVSRREVEGTMLEDIVEHLYHGSATALLQGLVDSGLFTKEDLTAAAQAISAARS